ncbi:COP9 signalosome complex subunit 7a isoform X1 [Acipenser ruthenus]|uniref:COP9 signalosome complex subunit 7a isoform X1 n=1 Tax=Acipenser ruthenus TaxID=7906 RepID=UPI00145B27C8|nr:COP9 signalosome complex subunit 7a isoform X1 [Acipenser ruthenus]XP_033896400.1 COP9 signalosome complex subunit 7a isoform X1 [Acipenser ruthenus]XP_033896401.1 COP9 signalosome complex subunit 7a isoform X1 [Acipenser ruthenus]XP_058848490.1 COP9 signalosome complex subunit 7a isoform X1 [Acipenser ruthenus]
MSAAEVKAGSQNLEQFLLLAKSTKGAALAALLKQLLESPGVYVFGEVLDMPNVRELESGPHASVYQLLNLFAYGTYCDYKENASSLPELSAAQKNKLRHLSIVTLAANLKCLPYSLLLTELEMRNVRELEDLIIEAIYADIIQGKLDQHKQQVEVDFSMGRDLQRGELPSISHTLQEWCSGCEAVLAGIEEQVMRANQYREHQLKVKQQVENEAPPPLQPIKTQSSRLASRETPPPPRTPDSQPARRAPRSKGCEEVARFGPSLTEGKKRERNKGSERGFWSTERETRTLTHTHTHRFICINIIQWLV